MPFEIVRDLIAGKTVHALVTPIYPKSAVSLFGPRAGSVSVSAARDGASKYVRQTVCPVWKDGSRREEALLRRCYEQSLKLAERTFCW